MLGFFHKLLGFLKKVGKFLQNVGIFGRKLWWGQVGIFGKFGGDFLPEPSGNTDVCKHPGFKKKMSYLKVENQQWSSYIRLQIRHAKNRNGSKVSKIARVL